MGAARAYQEPMAMSPLYPVKDVLRRVYDGDEEARQVLDDWVEEQPENVASELWHLTNPTDFQRRITRFVIGRGTRLEHCPAKTRELGEPMVKAALFEARRQLEIHRHAQWVRLVSDATPTRPVGSEVMLDGYGSDLVHDPVLGKLVLGRFRARCSAAGCANLVVATHPRQDVTVEQLDEIVRSLHTQRVEEWQALRAEKRAKRARVLERHRERGASQRRGEVKP